MKKENIFFDTSVLVSSFVISHPAHNRSYPYFDRVCQSKNIGFISSHSIAELYAVLSVLPIKPKLSPIEVQKILEHNIYPKFKIIQLETQEYKSAIQRATDLHLRGGILYDSLHIEAALKAKVNKIITLNGKHFELLAKGDMTIISI